MWIKRLVFTLNLLLAVTKGFGQTQAPVAWDSPRWFDARFAYHMGLSRPFLMLEDTLIVLGERFDSVNTNLRRMVVARSTDNGLTFSSWQQIGPAEQSVIGSVIGNRDRAFLFVPDVGLWQSLDVGLTWQFVRPFSWDSSICPMVTMAGRDVYRIESSWNNDYTISHRDAVVSHDLGDSWLPPARINSRGVSSYSRLVAATREHVLLMLAVRQPGGYSSMGWTRSDRAAQVWTPEQTLPDPIGGYHNVVSLTADSTSETALYVDCWGSSEWNDNIYVRRTTDGGQSWEPPRALATGHEADFLCNNPDAFCRGKLWGVAWNDEWNPDVTRLGVYWRFSANHGKNWYPPQWLGIGPTCMHYSTGQFVGSDVRLYWQQFDPNTVADGYRTVTGHLTPDTQNPHVTLAAELPQEPEVGDSVHFLATATDNDTLSEVRVRLLANGEALAPILLTREAGVGYRGEFQVPAPGFYQYRGEAEDFWENVGTDPDSGWQSFATHGWSGVDLGNGLLPTAFTLTAFPNPFNSTTQLQFTLQRAGHVRLKVYDVMGREVATLVDRHLPLGTHQLRWEAGAGPSGIYFVRLDALERTLFRKVLLVR